KLEAARQGILAEIAALPLGDQRVPAIETQLASLNAVIAQAKELLLLDPTQFGQEWHKVLEQLKKAFVLLGIKFVIEPPKDVQLQDAIAEIQERIRKSQVERELELRVPFKLKLEAFTEDTVTDLLK